MPLFHVLSALGAVAAQPQSPPPQSPAAATHSKPGLLSADNRKRRTEEDVHNGRIIGGVEARDGEYPWQVSLYDSLKAPSTGHFCGGTLISAEWVVTAAHCFADGIDFRVYAGSQNLLAGGAAYEVAKLIIHQDYDPFTSDNDIALVRLGKAVSLPETRAQQGTAVAKPAPLIEAAEAPRRVAPPELGVVTGWGRTSEKGVGTPRLQMIEAPFVARDECNAADKYAGNITENMLCAGGQGKDSCQGDSGGPLVVLREDGTFILAGIVSWGEGCAKEGFPGIYTNVARYLDWVRQNTDAQGG